MKETLQALDNVRMNFNAEGLLIMNITLAIIMFGIALDIKSDNFKNIAKNPKSTILGVISQFFLLPAVTFGLAYLLKSYITTTIALGMILVASCPGGNISNFITSLSKGNVALSVSLTAIATLAAIIMTPFNFAFYGSLFAKNSDLVRPLEINPVEMFKTVFILLGIPLLLGLWVAKKFPKTTKKIIKPFKIFGIIIFFMFVLFAFISNFDYFIKYVHYIFFIVLLHNAVALSTGYFWGRAFKLPNIDCRTMTIETGIQNSGLALVLIFNPAIFPENLKIGGMTFIAAWWGIWHMVSGFSIAGVWGRKPINKKNE